ITFLRSSVFVRCWIRIEWLRLSIFIEKATRHINSYKLALDMVCLLVFMIFLFLILVFYIVFCMTSLVFAILVWL
ncbi:hypothetical protein LINPERPRIM_LOCUS16623, partial [Linum perenne]